MDDEDDWDDAVWSTIDALETSHRQRKQTDVPSHAPADAQWACGSCTLLNSFTRTTCSVCNTPRGGVYTAHSTSPTTLQSAIGAACAFSISAAAAPPAASSFVLSQHKKSVQATLPFAKTGGTFTSTVSRATATVNSSQRRSTTHHHSVNASVSTVTWPSRATSALARAEPAMDSKSTGPLSYLLRNGTVPTNGNDMDGGIDDPVGGAAGIAVAARLRHKGEDAAAKMRYHSVADAPLRHQHPQIDRDAASTFVYPTNYSVREYQLTIAEKALYHNTLVSLPTGLGKTLIASVVMYNFYRWFPQGQIVFMAPTKPLVAQQIGACHEIMGIPLCDTAELQGSVPPSTRKVLWSTKRVFFCTPQSMQNDLQRGICCAERLVCLVVDEAHRATGNYAYCGVIQEVEKLTKQFRILALSATPGAKFDVIQDVIRNLRITHIESRSADDSDVKKYTHARQEEVIKCSLNAQIADTKTLLLRVFERITQRLLAGNIIQHKDPERLTRWYVLQMRERLRTSPSYQSNRGAESDLAVLVGLLHARDLLTGHGLASFKGWLDGFMTEEQEKGKRVSWSKKELLQSTEFQALRLSVEHINAEDSPSSSHPKLLKLREVLHEHFQRHAAGQSSTRAIVFTQYRSSVQEIVKLLEPLFPLIKAQQFIGQGASGKAKESKGQTQKEQQEIVRKFRLGLFNVLVATCIAEEGLDIGEVDLIVSFDALTSPVRMIQRMGRTGRKRVGKVVILVTEGDEEKKLARSVASAKTVSRALTTFKSKFVYGKCARMIPEGIAPELTALEMVIPEFHASQIAGKQTMTRSTRTDAVGMTERRDAWKLNELERSIVRGKYTPQEWSDTRRHEFRPISASRKVLLRRRSLEELGRPASARSRALLTLVRKINGVQYDDEICDPESRTVETPSSSTLDVYRTVGQHDDDVLEFSDPEDAKEYDHHMHFSPPNSAAPLPSEPMTPARSEVARTPRTFDSTHRTKHSTPIRDCEGASGVRVSPLRHATITGKPSPSPSRRSSGGNGRKNRKKVEKPRDAIDEDLLKRGERLLERLNAMLSDSTVATAEAPSPEPEPSIPPDDWPAAELQFEFPRIARRLKFDESCDGKLPPTLKAPPRENCVPPPPTLQDIFSPNPAKMIASGCSRGGEMEADLRSERSASCNVMVAYENIEEKRAVADVSGSVSTVMESHISSIGRVETDLDANQFSALIDDKPVMPRGEFGAAIDTTVSTDPRPKKPKRRVPIAIEAIVASEVAAVKSAPRSHPDHDLFKRFTSENRRDVDVKIPTSGSDAQLLSQRRSASIGSIPGEACSVCCEHESFDDDPIVFCDGCDAAVHQFCYGIPVLPSDEWYCDSCSECCVQGRLLTKPKPRRCALCPMRTLSLAMKQTECDQWVHIQCFMWVPELQFSFESKTLLLGQLGRLDPDRKSLDCSLCHSKRGYGVIQCAHKRCLNAFHVSCASATTSDQNYKLVQLEQDEDEKVGTLFIAYCPHHNKSTSVCKPTEKLQTSGHGHLDEQSPLVSFGTPARSPSLAAALSPSTLLASQIDSSKKQRKQFRRLKRKYETPSLTDGTAERTPPTLRSPWAKRVRRSQQHAEGKRAQAKALAHMFIDDEVDAPSSGGEDEDEDEDDEMNEEDRDFINDSSQLIYSQSVPTPIRKKKSKRNSLGDMRAIYARSLIESPQTPAFLRRGRGNLPSGGIIRACLQELHEERDVMLSTSPSSDTQTSPSIAKIADGEAADIIEILDESLADPHSNRDDDEEKLDDQIGETSLPCFNLLGMAAPARPTEYANHSVLEERAGRPASECVESEVDASRRLREKIEANRLKALQLLEAKKIATNRRDRVIVSPLPQNNHDEGMRDKTPCNSPPVARPATALNTTSPVRDDLLPSRSHEKASRMVCATNKKLQSPDFTSDTGGCNVSVYVQPAFCESQIFQVLEGCSAANSDRLKYEAIDSLDVTALLSLRVAATIIELKSSGSSTGLHQHPMVDLARAVYKSFLLVVHVSDSSAVRTISQSKEVRHLLTLPSCRNVIVACDTAVISRAMLVVAREEASLGFGLSSTSTTNKPMTTTGGGVDGNFHERFQFFRSTGLLSMGSVISLSFRFDRFTVQQIPVTKFSDMHWRRMLPWITERVAQQLHTYFLQSSG